MSMEAGKTAYKSYQKGSRYGKFNSGDNAAEGGSVVKGVSGPIHIRGDDGGIEKAIMKAQGAEGEYVLAQRNGYKSLDEVPPNETTGYLQYGWRDALSSAYKGLDTLAGGYLPGGIAPQHTQDQTFGERFDQNIGDPLQQALNIGEYSDEAQRNVELEGMLGSQIGSAITGQGEMEGFIGEQLAEQKIQFGAKREQFDTQTTGVQQGMGQYAGARDIQKKTGLITDTSPALETMETQGKMQMANIGTGRTLLASQERGAETQADIDIAQGKQRTQASLASMLSDYMTATGETIDSSFMDMFTDYQEGTFTNVEDYT